MTGGGAHVAVYRRITRLYPPSFRHNYGADLVTLFAHQIQDEPPIRVWFRTLRDLAVSVPTQHSQRSRSSLWPSRGRKE